MTVPIPDFEPSSREEAEWLARTRSQLSEATPPFDATAHWARVRARIPFENRAPRPRWPFWRFFFAYGLGAATAAAITLAVLPRTELPASVAPLGVVAPARREAMLQVVFHDQASVGEVRALLHRLGADVVSGPGSLGVWKITVARDEIDAAVRALSNHPTVAEVYRP